MTKLLFSLRGVPEDEAEDVRELLEENNIDYYETNAGNWGISMPGLWVHNKHDWLKAKELLQIYQANRYEQQSAIYQQMKQEGKHKGLLDMLKENPTQTVFYLAFIIFILYISIKLVFEIGL